MSCRTLGAVIDPDARPTCDACGFDGARWSDDDLERTLAHTDDLIGYVTAGAAPSVAERLPNLERSPAPDDVAAVHRLMHHLDRLARRRAEAEPTEPMAGTVESVHVSAGGVPKLAIPEATIDAGGIVGDGQSNRRHHGRPWQALCVWSADRVDELASEGHPVTPGAAGENLLIRGVDWAQIRGGLTIEIGAVVARTSSPAAPCHKIGDCFTERHWNRIAHEERPGWSRWYASVLRGGTVRPGDAVTIRA
jgi:MOSC domain-containing protein YiiM